MNFQNQTFTHILKQYLKGKKDNIGLILISLRDFFLQKYNEHKLQPDEMKILLKFLIHGIDTYSFEKSISFYNYINLYIDISLESYKIVKDINEFKLPDDEFLEFFITDIQESIEQNKTKEFKLN